MNRKKILICLNGNDDALFETEFIEQNLDHPYNLVVKFHLESILNEEVLEPSVMENTGLISRVNGHNGQVPRLENGHNGQGDVHTYGANSNSKRQIIHSSSVKELLNECQFADLLIIRKANFESLCNHYGQKKELKEILKKAECPVLVIPDMLSKIEQILLFYDGSANALNAIKMLRITLAPLCRELPFTVIIPSINESSFSSSQEKMLIEYLRLHFKDLGIHKVCEESAHTLQFAIYPDKNLLMVFNTPNQALPSFLNDELKLFTQGNKSNTFQFFISTNR